MINNMAEEEMLVYFKCVREQNKLRIKITSPGYNPHANCQFPRAIRREGCCYSAPVKAISFARGPAGKFFYRVRKTSIKVSPANIIETKITVNKVYDTGDHNCLVCLDDIREVVIVPCGHYCLCENCANIIAKSTGKCPLCRGHINLIVTRDQIQT